MRFVILLNVVASALSQQQFVPSQPQQQQYVNPGPYYGQFYPFGYQQGIPYQYQYQYQFPYNNPYTTNNVYPYVQQPQVTPAMGPGPVIPGTSSCSTSRPNKYNKPKVVIIKQTVPQQVSVPVPATTTVVKEVDQVVDIVKPGISGAIQLTPLEAAMSDLEHKKGGHSEKYYYGRTNLSPTAEGESQSTAPADKTKNTPAPILKRPARKFRSYQTSVRDPIVYPYQLPDFTYPYQYQYQYQYYPYNQQQQYYNNYPYQQYIPIPQGQGSRIPQYSEVDANVDSNSAAVIPVVDVIQEVPSNKPFKVEKPSHYEVYTYD